MAPAPETMASASGADTTSAPDAASGAYPNFQSSSVAAVAVPVAIVFRMLLPSSNIKLVLTQSLAAT